MRGRIINFKVMYWWNYDAIATVTGVPAVLIPSPSIPFIPCTYFKFWKYFFCINDAYYHYQAGIARMHSIDVSICSGSIAYYAQSSALVHRTHYLPRCNQTTKCSDGPNNMSSKFRSFALNPPSNPNLHIKFRHSSVAYYIRGSRQFITPSFLSNTHKWLYWNIVCGY